MSGRTILVVILALICGLAAFVGISLMGQGGPAPVATRPVIFAITEIRRGALIQKEMVEIRQIAEAAMPPAALGKAEDVLDRIASMKMIVGDAVTDAKLEPKGARSREVPTGKLAFTVARADMPPLEVDDHVDVYFTTTGQNPPIAPLQDIPIWDLANADGKASPTNSQGPATLLVDPAQAASLNQGMNQGTLRLVRRNPNDPTRVVLPPPVVTVTPTIGLAQDISVSKRAYPLENSSASVTIGGHLAKGDHVDVLMTRKGEAGRAVTRTMPDIPVLFTRTSSGPNPVESQSVILSVDPEEAAALDRAQVDGTVHLALRKPGDHGVPAPLPNEHAKELVSSINPGMRAFTFQAVNPTITHGGRIRAGDHVDVVMIVKPVKEGSGMIARTMHNIEVLTLPMADVPAGEEKQTVTLLVTPSEAETLALAQSTGTLYLTLRKPEDITIPPSPEVQEAERLAQALVPGMRAFVMEATGASASLCNSVRPGDRLDLLLLGSKQAGNAKAANSRTLANVEVFRIQPANDSTTNKFPLLTLLVAPDEAMSLAEAQNDGGIQLSLRKPGDDQVPDKLPLDDSPGAMPYQEVTRTTITLRGTAIGADRLIYRVPVPKGARVRRSE